MFERWALWASTDAQGGIATYVRVMRQTPLWGDWKILNIVTHREVGAMAKVGLFVQSTLAFTVALFRRPSVAHLHSASDTSFVRKGILLWLSRIAGVPVVMHIHGSSFHDYHKNSSRVSKAVISATLRRASAVVALGEDRATGLREIAPKARVVVIPNAIRPASRTAQPMQGDPVHVVFLGRIGERKGTFRLIDAWAQLTAHPDFSAGAGKAAVLTIAGDGEVQRARSAVRDLGLQDSVDVREWLSESDVAKLLDSAQVLVLPSRHEGQPMAVLEAMARGLCVIAGGVGGLPEMIGGGCGVIVPPDDVEAIAAALRLIITDDEIRTRYGSAAYARVTNRYDVGVVWRRLDELYREVMR